jgi:hypothetical protein
MNTFAKALVERIHGELVANPLPQSQEPNQEVICLRDFEEVKTRILQGGTEKYELLAKRMTQIDLSEVDTPQLLSRIEKGSVCIKTLYTLLAKRTLSEKKFSEIAAKAIKEHPNKVSVFDAIRLSMRMNTREGADAIRNALEGRVQGTYPLEEHCNEYKYQGRSIEEIRKLRNATECIKDLSIEVNPENLRDVMSLATEKHEAIYKYSKVYNRTLEGSVFHAFLVKRELLYNRQLLRLITSQFRGAIASWVFSCQENRISQLDSIVDLQSYYSALELIEHCENGSIIISDHRQANLFIMRMLEPLGDSFTTFMVEAACFGTTLGNPRQLYCSSIWSDRESLVNFRAFKKKKMHLHTLIDPDIGGEPSIVKSSTCKYLIDTHAFKLSRALRVPLIYTSCNYDLSTNLFRLRCCRIRSHSIPEMASEYIENLKHDLILAIGD